MPKQTNEDSARQLQRRLQPFLDCVAHLLAKRWLHDQRQQEDSPTQKQSVADERPKSWQPES